jgi:hypothetical protein
MGLLTPESLALKSFGMFYYGAGVDQANKGYVVAPGDMLDTNLNPKFMIVSLFSNTWASGDFSQMGAGDKFTVLFSSSAWNTKALDSWTPPTAPTAASASPVAIGARILSFIGAFLACSQAYFVY